jgi:imidazolonepropionase
MKADWIIENLNLATLDAERAGAYGVVNDAALAVADGKIAWLGARSELPDMQATEVVDCRGGWLTPGLVDCHTHLVYAGDRAEEFERRCQGWSYEEIARAGGGIRSTVAATRAASESELFNAGAARLERLRREGVTCVEIKSGYGLEPETELRMLRVARALGRDFPVTIRTTLLAAHVVPEEYAEHPDDYVSLVCDQILPAALEAGLVDAVDVFCERIAFSPAQCGRIFSAAARAGIPVKAHAEQLSYQGGARLAAEYGALSVDHLEYLREGEIALLRQRGVVAVLLPGAWYFLRETRLPPVAAMRAAGLPMAVATDLNPGSSPIASLLLAMNQACVLFGLDPEEALAGATREAARALGLGASKGLLRVGHDADLVLWDIRHPAELSYAVNINRPAAVWHGGAHVVFA